MIMTLEQTATAPPPANSRQQHDRVQMQAEYQARTRKEVAEKPVSIAAALDSSIQMMAVREAPGCDTITRMLR